MAVAPTGRAFDDGANWSKNLAGETTEGAAALKIGAKQGGGAVVQVDAIASNNNNTKGGLYMGLRGMFSCLMQPITTDEEGAPKRVTIGHNRGNDDDRLTQLPNKKVRVHAGLCDKTKSDNCPTFMVDDDDAQLRDVEENFVSAREGLEGNDSECGICHTSKAEDVFHTSCSHQFCRSCIKKHVSNALQEFSNPTLEVLATLTHCPESSCSEELCWRDLVDLLGDNRVRSFGRWLVLNYSKFFAPLTRSVTTQENRFRCSSSKCDQKNSSVILSPNNKNLLLPEVGFTEEGSKVFWSCTSCEALWCAFCGKHVIAGRSRSERNKMHVGCKGQWKFLVYRCIVDLDEACRILQQGRQHAPVRKTSSKSSNLTIWAAGTGFGGDSVESKKTIESMVLAAKKQELERDAKFTIAFNYLSTALDRKNGLDRRPSSSILPAEICVLLCWGGTLKKALHQLAANDSMLDISERRNLYTKMVALLKAIKLHKQLEPILLEPKEADIHEDQEVWVGDGSVALLKRNTNGDEVIDKDNTVLKKMQNIYKQAKVMVLRFQANATTDVAAQMDFNLAKDICECYEFLQDNLTMDSKTCALDGDLVTTNIKARDKEKDLKHKQQAANYKEKLKEFQFQEVIMVDEKGQYRHHFRDQIAGKASQATVIDKRGIHNQKRMLHVVKEVSSLSTTLPLEWESGIHLCVDQHRMDVLRALIVGPNGSPYQNGIFLFDIFLPPDYPQVPPSVHFLTTGGGKVRFNPNLYNTGKICLSLLGTWNGPGWTPGKSTLLQVLVSIQSLIFVQEPYYNEPGYEGKKSVDQAAKENTRHREHTLSLAILAPLQKPDPMFANLIHEHFKHKREEVQQQCSEWLDLTTETAAKQRMITIIKDIESELQNHFS